MANLSGFVKRLRDIMRNDAGINGDAQRLEQIAWLLFLKVYDAKEQDWEFEEDDYVSIIPPNCRWSAWAHDPTGKGLTGDALLNFVISQPPHSSRKVHMHLLHLLFSPGLKA